MKIGIVGIGTLTLELARRASLAGFEIIINNPRGNSLIESTVERLGTNVKVGTILEATVPQIVLIFIPKDDLETVLKSMPDMAGKTVIHTSSLIFNPKSLLSGIANAMTYKTTASLLPKAHVVKLLNPIKLEPSDPTLKYDKDEIFFISDHLESKFTIKALLKRLNFTTIDLSGRVQLQQSIENYPIAVQKSTIYKN